MTTKTPSRVRSLTSSACRVCPERMISAALRARFSAGSSTVESWASLSKKKSATPRTRSMAPIARAINSVRRHLMGKCSRPLQGVALPPDGADQLRLPGRGYPSYSMHLFFLTFLEERVASILSCSYQYISIHLHLTCPASGLHPQISVFDALFIGVRGRVVLGSTDTQWDRCLSSSPNLYAPPQHVVPPVRREGPQGPSPRSVEGVLCRILQANFREILFHALR